MRYSIAFGVSVLASIAGTAVANTKIKLEGFPTSGTYEDLASFDENANCPKKTVTWNGITAPLDEELSLIFRGPMRLKQVAVYSQDENSKKKRSPRMSAHKRRHGHQRFHERNQEMREEKRGAGDMVVATIDGKVVSFVNDWSGPAAPTPGPAAPAAAPVKAADVKVDTVSSAAAPAAAKHVDAGTGNWGRVAYYNAEAAHAEGLSFLGNVKWTSALGLGKVLSYVTPDGKNASSSQSVLEDSLIPDNTEIIISSDKPCKDGDCGVVCPGADAHHGFGGKTKLFLAEYSMPKSGMKKGGAWDNFNPDMPSFWALNSKAVNAQQYGKCSCWKTGCGEWDIHEVLVPGADAGSVSVHMGKDYAVTAHTTIDRPSDDKKTMKIAAILTKDSVHVQVLDDGMNFDEVIQGSTIDSMVNGPLSEQIKVNINPSDISESK